MVCLTLSDQGARSFSQQKKAMKASSSSMSAFMPFSPPSFLSEHHAPPPHMALPPRIPETRLRSSMSVRCPQEDEPCKKMETETTVISITPSTDMLYNPSDSYAMTLLLAPSNTMPYNSSGFREADHSLFDTAPPCSSGMRHVSAGEQDSMHTLTPPNVLSAPFSSAQGTMMTAASNERKDEVSMPNHVLCVGELALCKRIFCLILIPAKIFRPRTMIVTRLKHADEYPGLVRFWRERPAKRKIQEKKQTQSAGSSPYSDYFRSFA
jgi:hypothetical protein